MTVGTKLTEQSRASKKSGKTSVVTHYAKNACTPPLTALGYICLSRSLTNSNALSDISQ